MQPRVRAEGVGGAGVSQRVAEQGELAMVEPGVAPQKRLDLTHLATLAPQVAMQLLDGPLDDLQLAAEEVRRVAVVRLGEQVCARVLTGGLPKDA